MKAVKIAHEAGVLVSYDTNLRVNLWESMAEARDAMDELLPYIDIIMHRAFPHEPAALIDLHTEREVIDWFLERGVGTVALKCGAEGAWVGTEREIVRIPGVAPRGLLHTSGAGDTFVGGLLHCIARGNGRRRGSAMGRGMRRPQGRRPQHRGPADGAGSSSTCCRRCGSRTSPDDIQCLSSK